MELEKLMLSEEQVESLKALYALNTGLVAINPLVLSTIGCKHGIRKNGDKYVGFCELYIDRNSPENKEEKYFEFTKDGYDSIKSEFIARLVSRYVTQLPEKLYKTVEKVVIEDTPLKKLLNEVV